MHFGFKVLKMVYLIVYFTPYFRLHYLESVFLVTGDKNVPSKYLTVKY